MALPKYLVGHLWNIHMLSIKNCICFAVNSCREGHDQFWRRDFYFIPICQTCYKCKIFAMDICSWHGNIPVFTSPRFWSLYVQNRRFLKTYSALLLLLLLLLLLFTIGEKHRFYYFLLRCHCDCCGQNDNIMLVSMKHSGIIMARGVEALKSSSHERWG